MIDTIRDTQLAIKEFQKSIGLNGLSQDNGQSVLLKSSINSIKEHHEYILQLASTTLIKTIDEPLRSKIVNLQSYLLDTDSFIDTTLSKAPNLININDYRFKPLNFNNSSYIFDLTKVPVAIQDKLSVSQRFSIYLANEEYLETGLITNISKNSRLNVSVKNPIAISLENIGYGCLDLKWNVQEYISVWVDNSCFEDSNLNCWLHVKLYNVNSLYNCGWSLYYRSNFDKKYIEVAKGTDNVQPGYAYLSKSNSLFKPGDYLLKSKIIKYGMYETDLKRIEWNISDSRNYLKNE